MLSKEQLEQIRKQLISQIQTTFPEDKKAQAISELEAMDEDSLEQFLIQNNLIKSSAGQSTTSSVQPPQEQQCIFCSIAGGTIESYKIDENKKAVAVLEINPASKGHVIIIPKEHVKESGKLPSQAMTLAKKLSKKIKSKLKPREVKIESSNFMGHEILNVLPIYENESLASERKQAPPEDLQTLQEILKVKPKSKTIKKSKTKVLNQKEEKIRLPIRIP